MALGRTFHEIQLRGVLRQLIALGAVAVDAQAFNTLHLTDKSRAVLRGEVAVQLRESVSTPAERKSRSKSGAGPAAIKAPIALDGAGAGALCGAEGLARRGGTRAQFTGLCDFS